MAIALGLFLYLGMSLWIPVAHATVPMAIESQNPSQKLVQAAQTSQDLSKTPSPEPAEQDKSNQWNYQGKNSPSHWSELQEDYILCSQGQIQSPINLSATDYHFAEIIEFNPIPTKVTVINNGHTIQINYPKGQIARINGKNYELQQVHFHTPSEHQINGVTYAMETHLVYRDADATSDGNIAVLSTMVEPGLSNQNIATIWQHLPAINQIWQSDVLLSPEIFLPAEKQFSAQYSGSLTTPPCTEGVTWIVFQQPISFSPEQIAAFQALYPVNARPIQRGSNSND
jgi:carbonic anhydrase